MNAIILAYFATEASQNPRPYIRGTNGDYVRVERRIVECQYCNDPAVQIVREEGMFKGFCKDHAVPQKQEYRGWK